MKKFLLLSVSAVLLTACGGPDIPEIPDMENMPSADEMMADINSQIEADLAAAGIDVDMEEVMEDNEKEEQLDEMPELVADTVMKLDMDEGTASELWSEVKKFAEADYPGATLVAYNSFDAEGTQDLFLPESTFVDGKSAIWYFFFAIDGALDDEEVYNSEVVAVEFKDGELSFTPGDYGVFTDAGGDQLFGDDLVSMTAKLANVASEKIEMEAMSETPVVHYDFECRPVQTPFADGNGFCTVYAFEEGEAAVYEIGITPVNGEVYSFEYAEIETFSV